MNKNILFGILIIPLIIITSGCLKNNYVDYQALEQTNLKNYLAKNNITVPKTKDGLYYIEQTKGTGDSVTASDYVIIDESWYTLDGTLIGTNDTTLAGKNTVIPFVSYVGPQKIKVSNAIRGLSEGLQLMKAGGSAELIVPSSLAYGGAYIQYGYYSNQYTNPYTTIIINVQLHKVIADPVVDDSIHLAHGLAEFQLKDTIAGGIYMKIDTQGNESVAKSGDTIKYYFIIKSLDTTFTLGKANYLAKASNYIVGGSNYIPIPGPGIGNVLSLMSADEVAEIIIPYKIAGGTEGSYTNSGMTCGIPPYTSLYCKFFISDIKSPAKK